MKIINPTFEILSEISEGGIKELQHIEKIGRVCYKSEDRITNDGESAKKFVKMLIEKTHEAMIEHSCLSVKFTVDRGVSHELVRHRIASFAQESTRYCVAGTMKLSLKNPHTKMSIEELYINKSKSKNGAWKKILIKQYNEDTGEIQFAHIKDVFFNGKRECIRLKTKLGYFIDCTPDHKIHTKNGFVNAGDLGVGDLIYVNGTECLYKNYDWLYYQSIILNKTFTQISSEFNYNVNTIKKWAKKLGIPQKGTGYFNKGRTPWNKGKRIAAQVEALRKYHHCGGDKTKILKEDTVNYQKHNTGICEICGSLDNLEVHHIDHNRNNIPDNLITLCESCHQRVHYQSLITVYSDKIVSIENIGVRPVYDIEMDSDYHNFVVNGVIVHNCNYSKDKFGNEISVICPMGGILLDNKTNSLSGNDISKLINEWTEAMEDAERHYFKMIEIGAAPQIARSVLPNSTKTEITITANYREWRNFFKLRMPHSAHPSMREVTIPLLKQLKQRIPIIFDDIEVD